MAKARRHPMAGASRRHGKSKRVKHTGAWGKKAKRKKAAKKAAKTRARKKAARSRAAKKGARKRKLGGRGRVCKSSMRKNRKRKKGSKRRGTTTTIKVGRVKAKLKCRRGRKAKGGFKKTVVGGKTHTVIWGRCIRTGG